MLGGDVVGNTVGEVLNLDFSGVAETATGAVESATSLADLGGIAGGDVVGGNLPALGDLLGGVTEDNPLGGDLLGGGLLGGSGGSNAAATSEDAGGRSFLRRGR